MILLFYFFATKRRFILLRCMQLGNCYLLRLHANLSILLFTFSEVFRKICSFTFSLQIVHINWCSIKIVCTKYDFMTRCLMKRPVCLLSWYCNGKKGDHVRDPFVSFHILILAINLKKSSEHYERLCSNLICTVDLRTIKK